MYFENKDWSGLSAEGNIMELDLEDIQVAEVKAEEDHHVIKIFGGFNGPALWDVYLHQIGLIMANLRRSCKDVWLISLENDCPDDVWSLKLGVRY